MFEREGNLVPVKLSEKVLLLSVGASVADCVLVSIGTTEIESEGVPVSVISFVFVGDSDCEADGVKLSVSTGVFVGRIEKVSDTVSPDLVSEMDGPVSESSGVAV